MQQSTNFNFEVLSTPVLEASFDAETTSFVHVSMRKNDIENTFVRTPSDIVMIIDVSGSMGDMANTTTVESSFNLLDIVIHAVKTVIHTAGPQDRISIVSFSNTSEIICGLTEMTETGKTQVLAKLASLDPNGGTNIWAGLKSGLDILFQRTSTTASTSINVDSIPSRNSALLLLTDGQPTSSYIPSGGHVIMMRNYCEKLGGKYPGVISTFGFGYSSDSELLKSLADEGGGMFSFIPDSGFVGTAFINSLANIFSTFTIDARLTIEPQDDTIEIVSDSFINCQLPYGKESWGAWVNVGSLQVEQQVDIVFKVTHPRTAITTAAAAGLTNENQNNGINSLIKARLEYHPVKTAGLASVEPTLVDTKIIYECIGPVATTASVTAMTGGINAPVSTAATTAAILMEISTQTIYTQIFRLQTVHILSEIMRLMKSNNMTQARSILQNLITTITTWLQNHDLQPPTDITAGVAAVYQQRISSGTIAAEALPLDCIKGLLTDLTGQVSEAISREEYYTKWGRHYLPSLQRAHALQQSNNFKDPGIQFYGGSLFKRIQNETDDIFNNLPLPPPRNLYTQIYHAANSAAVATGSSAGSMPAAAPVAYSMADYNNRNAGCIHGDCMVMLKEGKKKCVRELIIGDIVECSPTTTTNTTTTTINMSQTNDDDDDDDDVKNSISYGRIRCVVETKCDPNLPTHFISFTSSGLVITPWHPVMDLQRKWRFPDQIHNNTDKSVSEMRAQHVELYCDAVYSLLIERIYETDDDDDDNDDGFGVVVDNTSTMTTASATTANHYKKGNLTVSTTGAVSVKVNPPTHSTFNTINTMKNKKNNITSLTSKYHSAVIVNDIPCATLAHGILHDDIISHAYFGTHAILEDLKSYRGWSDGRVVVLNNNNNNNNNINMNDDDICDDHSNNTSSINSSNSSSGGGWIRCAKTGLVTGLVTVKGSDKQDSK